MRFFFLIVMLAVGLTFGCTTTSSRSIGSSTAPPNGTHRVYASSGRLLQRTVWRDSKLLEAWQYEQRSELPLELLTAVHPRWLQTVVNGNGRIHTFDEKGKVIGFEDYHAGEFWRGAH